MGGFTLITMKINQNPKNKLHNAEGGTINSTPKMLI
jgi:hypothetical protein